MADVLHEDLRQCISNVTRSILTRLQRRFL